MDESVGLARKYRPAQFRDVVAQPQVSLPLSRMLHDKEGNPLEKALIPEALLFTGGRGSGKTSTARIVGAALNCEAACRRPCKECASCIAVAAGHSLDVMEIDAASAGGVSEIRRIKEAVSYAAVGKYRVVILDEAHSMSKDAFNALLKVLEEPPDRTVFILVTTEAHKILKTVASRCTKFTFRRVPPAAIATRLRDICTWEKIEAEDALLHTIAERADGGMRDALMELDQMARIGVTRLAHYEMIKGESDFGPDLVSALASGNHGLAFGKVDEILNQTGDPGVVAATLVATFRDMLVVSSGGVCPAMGSALTARQQLAARVPDDRVCAALRVLWDLRRTSGYDTRSGLDLALAMCMDKLAPPKAASNGKGPNGHAFGVEEMRRLAAL